MRSFVVLTGSMEPTIKTHALIFTKPAHYDKNDMVAFKQVDKTIVHRIINVENKNGGVLYTTKGDANNAADIQMIRDREVLGKVALTLPYIGAFILFLKTVPGFLLFVVLPAFIFIALELGDIKKEIERETEKRILQKMSTT